MKQLEGQYQVSSQKSELGENSDGNSRTLVSLPRITIFLFFFFAVYMVLPLIEVPLLGISLSAPIFLLIAIPCLLKPPNPWFFIYRKWITLALLIWFGITMSTGINGMLSFGTKTETADILAILQYLYWLIVFVVTAYIAGQGEILKKLSGILGWSILGLAVVRWAEALIWNRMGSYQPSLMTQNAYGFLFSTFSPFLLIKLIQENRGKWIWPIAGNLVLWGAVAVNSSRGSWISIGLGLFFCLMFLFFVRKGKSIKLLFLIVFLISVGLVFWNASPRVASVIEARFNSFQTIEEDKATLVRELMIKKAIGLFKESPIIGVGIGRFTKTTSEMVIPRGLAYSNQEYFDQKSAHNSYLAFLAETGLLGSIPLLFLILNLGFGGLKSTIFFLQKRDLWALAVFLSFVQMSIHMFALSTYSNTSPWFIYGLIAAMIQIRKREMEE